MNPKVDFYFNKPQKWQEEIILLRKIVLDSHLTEELKWGCPCYTYQDKNIVLIHVFKEYCAFLFFKGALMKDEHKILIQQTENVQVPRQIRFNSKKQIKEKEAILMQYIYEAIEIEVTGVKISLKKAEDYKIPEEFLTQLNANPELKTAFEALTPGRQKGYLFHFSQPKLSKTRQARIEKCIQQIMSGKGLEDK